MVGPLLIGVRVHPTAEIEDGVRVGIGSSIWDHVHIRHDARLGVECSVGGKTYIAYDVVIGDRCKLNANVYVCAGVTLGDGVMVGAGSIFTNDRFPRATTPDLDERLSGEPNDDTLATTVGDGATLGAGCVVGPGLEIGRFAMVGMGSVVTRTVGDFWLCLGNPARLVGMVCRCGRRAVRAGVGCLPDGEVACSTCGRRYLIAANSIRELP